MTSQNTTTLSTPVPTMPAAFARQKANIDAVPEIALVPINVDIMASIVTARGAARKVATLLPDIERSIPGHDVTPILILDDVALACGYASSRHTLALAPNDELGEVATRAIRMRDLLTTDAQSCIKRGLLDGSVLKGIVGTTGYRALAHDVMLLSGLLRGALPTLGDRMSTKDAELDEADVLCAMLTDQVTMRENAPLIVAEAAKTRLRAFTLLSRTYDEVRRIVTFVRWYEDDVDDFAPSFYAGRGGKKRKVPSTELPKDAPTKQDAFEALALAADPQPEVMGMPGGSPLS